MSFPLVLQEKGIGGGGKWEDKEDKENEEKEKS